MEDTLNYKEIFGSALNKIKNRRIPKAPRQDEIDMEWETVGKQRIFDFGGRNFDESEQLIQYAKDTSYACVHYIILELFKIKNREMLPIKEIPSGRGIIFVLKDAAIKTLYLFQEAENQPAWKIKDKENQDIIKLMHDVQCDSCKHIYFMYDQAYLQIIGHNDDVNDPGRGYNLYSLIWFFENYFGKKESECFERYLRQYVFEVKECIGHTIMKTLSPWALVDFKKIVLKELSKKENYQSLLTDVLYSDENEYRLPDLDYERIERAFLSDKVMRTVLGSKDFAESIITAEWLLDTMEQAKAVDLTVIGMGYFKAIEQLLFQIIKIKNPSTIEHSHDDVLTLGGMATYFKRNFGVFRKDLSIDAKKYIREMLFKYSRKRNEYLHKENIHELDIIKDIRNLTFKVLFLLFGGLELENRELDQLGLINNIHGDYDRLCEYIDYHYGNIYFIKYKGAREMLCFAWYDPLKKLDENQQVIYSGVYFKEVGEGTRIGKLSPKEMPSRISLGKFNFQKTELVAVDPQIIKTIFEEGKYVGPTLTEDTYSEY